ncbi:hypothetical protein [Protaetiibacter intestinalis]|uniref:Uncharacterized protein n=1 Tax=Protaetiibacter intestinalis TaxID=2419774 RepID=A0A387BBD3_9MICO|nr:hypothetical protein [Protaetiibacter intestinalis]AYF98415.1 hypothetical protein D7I47_09180 [Protaetiibacter intestinalis]
MTTADTTETPELSPEGTPPPRRRLLPWIAGGAVLALLAGGIPLGIWIGNETAIVDAARDDAALLETALADAKTAAGDYRATAEAVAQYTTTLAVPVRDSVAGATAEFDQASADTLAAAVDAVAATTVSPLVRDADEGEQLPADPTADALSIRIEYLSNDAERFAVNLERRYRQLDGDARQSAREEVAAEAARLDELVELFEAAETEAIDAVDATDAAITAAAATGAETGAATLAAFQYAGEAERAAMQGSVDALLALAEVELPIAWQGRLADGTAPLATAPGTVADYVATTAGARASESANTPRSSGGGGGGQMYSCWIPGFFGGPGYLGWCYR